MTRKTSAATEPLDPQDEDIRADVQKAWDEHNAPQSTPSANEGPQEPAPTYPNAYDLAYERRNILQYLLSGIQLQVPFDAAPSAVAERIIQIADEVILKGQARGWIAKDPVPPAEPKAE